MGDKIPEAWLKLETAGQVKYMEKNIPKAWLKLETTGQISTCSAVHILLLP